MNYYPLALNNGVAAQRRRRDRDKRRAEKYLDKYADCIKKRSRKDSKCIRYKDKAKKYLAKADEHDKKIRQSEGTSLHIEKEKDRQKSSSAPAVKKATAEAMVRRRVDKTTIEQETGIDVTDPQSDLYVPDYDTVVQTPPAIDPDEGTGLGVPLAIMGLFGAVAVGGYLYFRR
jgi:hypothetical protein